MRYINTHCYNVNNELKHYTNNYVDNTSDISRNI